MMVGLRYQKGMSIPNMSIDRTATLIRQGLDHKLGIDVSNGDSPCIEARINEDLVPHACLMVNFR